jgi:hypothetical protein
VRLPAWTRTEPSPYASSCSIKKEARASIAGRVRAVHCRAAGYCHRQPTSLANTSECSVSKTVVCETGIIAIDRIGQGQLYAYWAVGIPISLRNEHRKVSTAVATTCDGLSQLGSRLAPWPDVPR